MKTFTNLIDKARETVEEIFPWDLNDYLKAGNTPVLLDIREPYETDAMKLKNTINVPRGVLEQAVSEGFTESHEGLIGARQQEIIIVCRSGNRSLLAAETLQQMGFVNVKSMKTGLRGWADYGLPLLNLNDLEASYEETEKYFYPNG